jgi:hypothetical protein
MQENLSCRRYYAQDYGGLPSTETRKGIVRDAMFVKG